MPRNLLAGRWLLVLVCYLDDSGKDPQNPITTVAGYVGREEAWQGFESEADPFLNEKGVPILHAKQLHDTDGSFEKWSVLQKQALVARLGQMASRHLMMGVSMSALKGTYQECAVFRAESSPSRRTVTPYTFCFQVVVDWLLRSVLIGRIVHSEGLACILECGHENNPQAEQEFYRIRAHYGLQSVLRSILFVPKDQCRAIQYADLLAFYSRRDGVSFLRAQNNSSETYEMETMLKIILETCPHRGFVATGFHDRPPA